MTPHSTENLSNNYRFGQTVLIFNAQNSQWLFSKAIISGHKLTRLALRLAGKLHFISKQLVLSKIFSSWAVKTLVKAMSSYESLGFKNLEFSIRQIGRRPGGKKAGFPSLRMSFILESFHGLEKRNLDSRTLPGLKQQKKEKTDNCTGFIITFLIYTGGKLRSRKRGMCFLSFALESDNFFSLNIYTFYKQI